MDPAFPALLGEKVTLITDDEVACALQSLEQANARRKSKVS